jgi:hypothetical protein
MESNFLRKYSDIITEMEASVDEDIFRKTKVFNNKKGELEPVGVATKTLPYCEKIVAMLDKYGIDSQVAQEGHELNSRYVVRLTNPQEVQTATELFNAGKIKGFELTDVWPSMY